MVKMEEEELGVFARSDGERQNQLSLVPLGLGNTMEAIARRIRAGAAPIRRKWGFTVAREIRG